MATSSNDPVKAIDPSGKETCASGVGLANLSLAWYEKVSNDNSQVYNASGCLGLEEEVLKWQQ